jgi:hypothetical protein
MKLKLPSEPPTIAFVRIRFAPLLMIAAVLVLGSASGALADTNSSSNWAGYAIHRPGLKFSKVDAVWTQPAATCQPGRRSYSAYWVGLGGYSETSTALEQVGTEVDCSASGKVQSSAWYELVPAASKTIRLAVRPGDEVGATVIVIGRRVTLSITDATTKRTFRKTLHAARVDVSSADWIVEAPSDCISATACQTLPLANFGSAAFALASAQTSTGHVGSISDHDWRASKISLMPGGGRRFVVSPGPGVAFGEAIPSALNATGTAFDVAYATLSEQPSLLNSARRAALLLGHLVHPGR